MNSLRVGMVVPWMNRTVEDELPELLQAVPVHLHWTRARPAKFPMDRSDESYLSSLIADVPEALERLAPSDLALVVLACTSASFDTTLCTLASETRVVNAFECVISALSGSIGEPLLLCTPYSAELTGNLARELEARGHQIERVARIVSPHHFREISPLDIAATIAREVSRDVTQILISCTALYTATVSELLEFDYGIKIPVTSSVSAIANFITNYASKHANIPSQQ